MSDANKRKIALSRNALQSGKQSPLATLYKDARVAVEVCGRKPCLTHVSGSSRVRHVASSRGQRKIKGTLAQRFVTNRSACDLEIDTPFQMT